MSEPKKVILRAPLLTQSGYGEQSRFALRSLRSRPDLFDIYIQPLKWGQTSWSREYDEEREWIDNAIEKTIAFLNQGGKFDMSLQITIPNEFENLAPVNIGYTAGIETTKMAPQWIEKINAMDLVMTISSHSKRVMEMTEYTATHEPTQQQVLLKTTTPIQFINYPAKTFESLPDVDLNLSTEFNFLCASQWSPRKNIENTIRWFVDEFREDDVGLIVKTSFSKNCHIDRTRTFNSIKSLLDAMGEKKCKVYLIHGDMTDAEMHALYNKDEVKAFISLAHGEGFGLTIFEAAYSGLPIIATGWSGQLDFLIDENKQEKFYNVSYDLKDVQREVLWEGVIHEGSMWAYPREYSARKHMRELYENYKDAVVVDGINERFNQEKMYAKFVEIFNSSVQDIDDWLEELSNELVVND